MNTRPFLPEVPTLAYLANRFPCSVEPYVFEEIAELRHRGVQVIPTSARRADESTQDPALRSFAAETLYLEPLNFFLLMRAAWLCLRQLPTIGDLLIRLLAQGNESFVRRMYGLLHTFLGACYALRLKGRGVQHIHVHHGYFSAWIAMVAARLLGIGYSLTLHGSDLLLHPAYLDMKLKHCDFCLTISQFNRNFILDRYTGIPQDKIIVQRMGVNPAEVEPSPTVPGNTRLLMLMVGRLHLVKDHAFLIHACYELKARGTDFLCLIAGEGPQRPWIEHLIRNLKLENQVKLLGHLSRFDLDACYALSDVVVLTSRSEGIPLVLMEAMAQGKTVLAPAITGIPELVKDGETGFLYRAGSLDNFIARLELIRTSQSLPQVRRAARLHVLEHFDREKNLSALADLLISRITRYEKADPHENPVLQQI
jgi:colanic acid/amylovoran biosynthesis glycosyltransferase